MRMRDRKRWKKVISLCLTSAMCITLVAPASVQAAEENSTLTVEESTQENSEEKQTETEEKVVETTVDEKGKIKEQEASKQTEEKNSEDTQETEKKTALTSQTEEPSKTAKSRSAEVTSGQCGENAYWNFDKTSGTLTISGSGAIEDYDTYYDNGGPWHSDELKYAIIEEGITEIGEYAFYYCVNLEKVELPQSLRTIGKGSFFSCSSLNNVKFPNKITNIEYEAFYGCSDLEAIDLPESIEKINESVFGSCTSLQQVTLPSGLKNIRESAFGGCSALKSIDIPRGITGIDNGVFSGCSSLQQINLPETLTSIGEYSFSGCESLIEIKLPDSLSSIGEGAFCGDSSLMNIQLPQNLKTIKKEAFRDCDALVTIEIPKSVTSIGEGIFYNCSALETVLLQDNLTEIAENMFEGCASLKTIEIPESVTIIKENAFRGSGIQEIQIPGNVKKIGNEAFRYCYDLKNVKFDEGITQIDESAFDFCKSLERVELPETLTYLGDTVFYDCNKLKKIVIREKVSHIGESVFVRNDNITIYGIPGSYAETYAQEHDIRFKPLSSFYQATFKNLETVEFWQTYYKNPFQALCKSGNFPHYLYMVANDTSFIGKAELASTAIYNGSDGVRDMLSSSTSVKQAEEILVALLYDQEEEQNELANVEVAQEWGSVLSRSYEQIAIAEGSKGSLDNYGLIQEYFDSNEFADTMKKSGYEGVKKELLKKLPASSKNAVGDMLDKLETSDILADSLDIIDVGTKIIDLQQMTLDNIYQYNLMVQLDQNYQDILKYLSESCIYDVVKQAAGKLYKLANSNLEEAQEQLFQESAIEAGVWLGEEGYNKLVDSVWFLKLFKLSKDAAVTFCNTFFHTGETIERKNAMRSMTYIGMAMSQYVLDNLATMQNLKGENRLDEAEEYAKKVVVSTRTLWKARVEGEKCCQEITSAFMPGEAKVYECSKRETVMLTGLQELLFNPAKVYKEYWGVTASFACPVDVEVYDSNKKLVLTLEDGKEADGKMEGLWYETYYNPITKDYGKILYTDGSKNYSFKCIGQDAGNVNAFFDTLTEDGKVTTQKFNQIAVSKGDVITVPTVTNSDSISYTVTKKDGTVTNSQTALESLENGYYKAVEGIALAETVKTQMKTGEEQILSVVYTPQDATIQEVDWTSSDEKVLTVSGSGLLKAVGAGKATVTAVSRDGQKEASVQITVTKNEETSGILGDVDEDGKIGMKDARLVLKAAVGSEKLTDVQKKAADVDKDGKVGMKDARLILKYAVGSIREFKKSL